MEKRKSGFYWVKTAMINSGKWITAEFSSEKGWKIPGMFSIYTDTAMVEINENRIMSPDEWD